MLLVIPISHKDITNAVRLVKWMRFLSGESMRVESVLLVPSRSVAKTMKKRMAELADAALETFGKAFCFVPATEDERGWPHSPNFMFREALCHVEQHFEDDVFWLEPDAVPLHTNWFSEIKGAFLETAVPAGKTFMGDHVQLTKQHMSGIGVYGKNWRAVAPMLSEAGAVPWDVYAAKEVMVATRFTNLIQHVPNSPYIGSLRILKSGAVVFHSDKHHRLMRLLDMLRFNGEFFKGTFDVVQERELVMKYYHADNATRRIRAGDVEIAFEPYSIIGGAVAGVYATEVETEQWALSRILNSKGITEITEAEYNDKKKAKGSSNSGPLSPRLQQAVAQAPMGADVAPLVANVAKEEAAVPELPQSPIPLGGSIDDVLEMKKIQPVEPLPQVVKPKRRKQKMES